MNTSDTPRIDAVMAQINTHPEPETIVELARELERELARKEMIICELQTRIDNDTEDHAREA